MGAELQLPGSQENAATKPHLLLSGLSASQTRPRSWQMSCPHLCLTCWHLPAERRRGISRPSSLGFLSSSELPLLPWEVPFPVFTPLDRKDDAVVVTMSLPCCCASYTAPGSWNSKSQGKTQHRAAGIAGMTENLPCWGSLSAPSS